MDSRLLLPLIAWLLIAPPAVAAQKDYAPYPQPGAGYVTDIADVLSKAQEDRIENWLYSVEEKTGVEIVVVIINSIAEYPGTANASIESFATGLFDSYGIGNMPENDGVLLIMAVEDRKARIELGAGYGRRHDARTNRILQNVIIPKCRQSDYAGAATSGARALAKEFGRVWIIPGWVKIVVLLLILTLIPITISLFRNGKRGWGWVFAGFIIVLLLFFLYLLKHTGRGGGDTGLSAGGFGGGFGGGFSGGGGATGSW